MGGFIVHVHLADVVVLHVVDLEVDQHKAAQDAVVKNQVHLVVCVVQRDAVLPPDEGEALAQLQQKWL